MKLAAVLIVLSLLAVVPPSGAAPALLRTIAESSGWSKTGRYDEVIALCDAFRRAYPGRVRKVEFGTTPEGRPMLALIASGNGALDAARCRRKGRPVVLFQGGIHAGEIDGKDAGFWALREILDGTLAPGALDAVTIVFVPVFNIDGHERFSVNNRPNQVGPEEMGWRTTGQNFNLNRDYTKADAPEMQAMLRLLAEWDPIAYVDLHVTDGAQFQLDLAVMVDPAQDDRNALAALGRTVRGEIMERLEGSGWLATPFYPSFKVDDDPLSGFALSAFPARLSNGYWAQRGRLGILVETHSWKDYAHRVAMTRDVIVDIVEMAARDGAHWLDVARRNDEADGGLAGTLVPLTWENSPESRPIAFPGYAYERRESAVSGGIVVVYDTTKPQVWTLPLFDTVTPKVTATAPGAGYVVPAAHAARVAEKLALHDVEFRRLGKALGARDVEAFRAKEVTFGKTPFEGHFATTVTGEWAKERRDVSAGSLFVPIAQPKARLVMTLLEPASPDSLLAWGFFSTCFERKEYMEAYVAEQVALEMMAKDEALAAEFQAEIDADPEFAKSSAKRLDFFYSRHPSWDERLNLYPIMRVAKEP